MSLFETANAWISNNQALVVSVGLPVFTLAITGWASFLSHRAKVSEVKLSGRLKLSEYRRTNFDELLSLSARLQSLFVAAAVGARLLGKNPMEGDPSALLEVIECANLFLLHSRASGQQIEQFSDLIQLCTDEFFHMTNKTDAARNTLGELRVACKGILDDEWSRIERELKGLA